MKRDLEGLRGSRPVRASGGTPARPRRAIGSRGGSSRDAPKPCCGLGMAGVGHAVGTRAVVDVVEVRVASVSEPPANRRVTLVRKAAGPSPPPTPCLGGGGVG